MTIRNWVSFNLYDLDNVHDELYDLDNVSDNMYDLDNVSDNMFDLDNVPDNLYDQNRTVLLGLRPLHRSTESAPSF